MEKIIIRPSRNAGKGKPSYAFYFIGQMLGASLTVWFSLWIYVESPLSDPFTVMSHLAIVELMLPVGMVSSILLYLAARYADLRRDALGIFFSTLSGSIAHPLALAASLSAVETLLNMHSSDSALAAVCTAPVALVCSLMVSFALPRPD